MGIDRDHIQVLKTLYDNGNISRYQMKSIRGQIFKMGWAEREPTFEKLTEIYKVFVEGIKKWINLFRSLNT